MSRSPCTRCTAAPTAASRGGKALATAYLVYAQVMRYERDRMRLPAEARYRSFLVDYARRCATFSRRTSPTTWASRSSG
ncbi:MAG: hypothetical protein IPL93_01045 [Actinomycetales bacterium]|nr:hypothetical protein [Actinomycetales bacterium]